MTKTNAVDLGTRVGSNRHVRIPSEIVTETLALLGKRGSGKSHAGTIITEDILEAGMSVVVIDPLDCWWGLRSSKDGRQEGYPIVVFGGEHADVPLNETSGRTLAALLVEQHIPAILSLRHFSKSAMKRFVADFCEELYRLKGKKVNREPLHVMIDEADMFCPQRVMGEDARVTGSIDNLVRRGRSSGIGVTLITQRAAVINKDVLTQTEVLFAFRMTGPQDKKAIKDWIENNADSDRQREILTSLAKLPIGQAWVWSPGWLNLLEEVKIRDRRTFDSSFTPKVGEERRSPKKLADVDLDAISESLAGAIEEAVANDPKILKRKVAELSRELEKAKGNGSATAGNMDQEALQRAVDTAIEKRDEDWNSAISLCVANAQTRKAETQASISKAFSIVDVIFEDLAIVGPSPVRQSPTLTTHDNVAAPTKSGGGVAFGGTERKIQSTKNIPGLGRCPTAILSVIASFPNGCTKRQFSFLSGYVLNGSSMKAGLSCLRSQGLIEARGELFFATQAAHDQFGPFPPKPTGIESQEYWLSKLGKCPWEFMQEFIAVYPIALTKAQLSERTAYVENGSSMKAGLSRLRSLYLINEGTDMRASEELFD